MVWDGNCGFCAYWITVWQRIVPIRIVFVTFQALDSQSFQDIERTQFDTAVRLIETNGDVHSGPGAAFRSLALIEKYAWLDHWYLKNQVFKMSMDKLYQIVADHRNFFFKVTLLLFGSNPTQLKNYWLLILGLLLFMLCMTINFPWKG